MQAMRLHTLAIGLALLTAAPLLRAADLHITIPRRSQLTPVQRLNRDGVEAVVKHRYDKAEALFYKAYLYDPADPFTLNNLGYISELQGQLDKAQGFYKLASEQGCGAVIDRSDEKDLRGKPMVYALDTMQNGPMHVNRMNIQAMEMLSDGRGFEAEAVLEKALKLEPQNPFTLNNLGVASESVGDYDGALRYYDDAAALRSSEPIVVTVEPAWRGKPVSQTAARSAQNLRHRLRTVNASETRAAMLELRGVSEVNQNEWEAARKDFLDAYRLDPYSAFTLNNLGYVAEKEGDIETAQFFYARSRRAADAGSKIGLATQAWAQGQRLTTVAANSTQSVAGELQNFTETRRSQTGPVQLIPRYGSDEPGQQPPASQRPQQ